jgi:hypothetical protein
MTMDRAYMEIIEKSGTHRKLYGINLVRFSVRSGVSSVLSVYLVFF